jgi:hypothetical protein
MASLTGTFDADDAVSGVIYIPAGQSFTVTLVNAFTGEIRLEEVLAAGGTVRMLKSYTGEVDENLVNDFGRDLRLRLHCVDIDVDGLETVDYTLADYDAAVNDSVTGTLSVAGATTLSSTLAVTGAATFSATVKVTGVTASNVTKALLDGSNNALLARCATANIPTGAGYAKGCLLVATDGTDHTNTLYCNIGDATTANFNAVTIAADA